MTMFDPTYDPMAELELLKLKQVKLELNQLEITKGFNHRGEIIEQLAEHIKRLTAAHNDLDTAVLNLYTRVAELELKNEQTNNNQGHEPNQH